MKTSVQIFLAFFFFTSFLFSQTIQWEQLNGPHGGTPLSFASNSNGDIFAGADQDQRGVFRSTDGGITWQPKSTGFYLNDRAFSWLVVDDSSYIIAGTNSHIGSKVYKSKDNGESWTQISILGGTSCAVNDSGHIYVGNTGYAQYSVSKDGGYTWTHYSHPSPFINCVTINDSGHIFIGGNYTGYRSIDNGANWTTLSLPDGINSIAVAPNGNLFAGCSREYAANSGVYRSTDNGDSWAPVKEGFRVYASHNIIINGNGDIIIGTWGSGIWKSTDNGDTWTQYNSGLGHFYFKSMYVTNNGDVYAGLSGGGIYRSSDNGESWTQVGITAAIVTEVAINSNDDIFASVWGISRSTDLGITWEPINNGLASYDVRALIVKNSNGYLFAGTNDNPNGIIFRSTDNGDSWVRVDNFPTALAINGLTTGPSGEIVATGSGMASICHISTDDCVSWTDIRYNLTFGPGKVGINSNGDIIAASWGGGMWRKLSGDTLWTNIGASLYPYIGSLFIGSNDYIYAEKYKSTDNGETWSSMPIVGSNISKFAENSLGHLFCGTYNYGNGVSRSTDYGENWEQINTGLPIMDIRSVAVDADDYLYAGTNGKSMFKTTKSTVTDVNEIKLKPVSFSLSQNFPNPFNPSTKISWQSPLGSWQTLKVFDVLGTEVATLVNDYKPAGNYEVDFQSSVGSHQLTSGVYFYQLKAGDFVQTRKMIFLK